MDKAGWVFSVGLSLLMSSAPARAATVIHDSGETIPLEPYLAPLQSDLTQITVDKGELDTSHTNLSVDALLPLHTPEMEPGIVISRPWESVPKAFFRPVFLIGSDQYSRQWLTENRRYLHQIGAVGLLVQADSREDLESIIAISDGMEIMPASGSDIARNLGLEYYPVLITREGILQ